MSLIYVTEHGCKLGVNGGLISIKHADERVETILKELVDIYMI